MKTLGPKTAVWKFATTTNNTSSRRRVFGALFLALAVVAAPAARAQLFADETARELAATNAEKIENLARVVQNMRAQLASLLQKQQEAAQKQRELLGKMEEISARGADKNALQEMQSELSLAAAERETLSQNIAALGEQFEDVSQFIELPPEQEIYESAYAHYRKENYPKAGAEFKRLLKYYPDGRFSAGAWYWLAENFMAQQQYQEAADTARQMLQQHGNSDKAPDAMLTLAEAQRRLQQTQQSRKTLEELIAQHPTALAADKARRLLAAP